MDTPQTDPKIVDTAWALIATGQDVIKQGTASATEFVDAFMKQNGDDLTTQQALEVERRGHFFLSIYEKQAK